LRDLRCADRGLSEEVTRMDGVKGEGSKNDWDTVQSVEQVLVRNDCTGPAVEEFYGTVDSSAKNISHL
jgi:hypothetical protein